MIDRERFEAYDRAVSANAELLEAAVREFVAACDGAPEPALRSTMLQAYAAVVRRYGGRVAQVACEMYADTRAAAGDLPAYRPTTFEPRQDGLLRWDVSRALGSSDAASSLAASARQRTMAYADETMVGNARADPAHPKWAIVPHAGACGWCVMLGSKGFEYRSEGTATASRHQSCLCSVVVDFDRDNPALEGYDPDAMLRAYRSCREAVEADARTRWEQMGPGERARYTRNGKSPSFDAYLRNRVTAEMNSRDRTWLQTGKAVATDYSLSPLGSYGRLIVPGDYSPKNIVDRGNEWRDLWVHHALEQNGIRAQAHGSSDIDLTIDGEWWEVKSPDEPRVPPKAGRELSFIESNFRSAVRQFKKRGLGDECRVVLNLRYRSSGEAPLAEIERQMRLHRLKEVLVIGQDGLVARLKA